MTVLRASNAAIGLDQGKPISTSAGPQPWIRPSDWITFTPPSASEQKVIGTVAVWNQDSNYLSVLVTTTDASQYTVDWGDGTSTNHNSNTLAEKNYTWSSISSGTVTSQGYRQALVTITPAIAGRTFATLQLSRIPTGTNMTTGNTSPWLDIAIAAPNATAIEFASTSGATQTNRMPARMLENVNLVSSQLTNFSNFFLNMSVLQNVNLKTTAARIGVTSMFNGCTSLRIAPVLPNMSGSTQSMFSNCSALQYVPLYNFGDPLGQVTTVQNMFSDCFSLETVPLFNTAFVTNFALMFTGCRSLRSIPNFNFSNAQSTNGMFTSCSSLESFPATNTGGFLSIVSNMFSGCLSLKSVGLFNISGSGGSAESMFSNCTALETVPAFNFTNCLNVGSAFSNCVSLQNVPAFTFGTGTQILSGMFNGCRSLREIAGLNLSAVTSVSSNNLSLGNATASSAVSTLGRAVITGNKFTQSFQNCLMGATQLNEMYTSLATLNPAITNISGNGTTVTVTVGTTNIRSFVAGRAVTITGVTPVAYNITGTVASVNNGAGNFTITNAATGTYVSGGIATITSDITITVTGNPGVATDDPTIATAKGWVVTG